MEIAGIENDEDCLTGCPVCAEPYTETGHHVPKLLPCTHSVCLKCLGEKVFRHQDNTLDCPKCGMNHEFVCGIHFVPVNPYIICSVKKSRKQRCIGRLTELCGKHERELRFFCWESLCQRAICSLCVKGDHKNHDWDDLKQAEEKLYDKLGAKSDSLKNFIKVQKEMALEMEKENNAWTKSCEELVESDKKELIRKLNEIFDKLRGNINSQRLRVDACIQDTLRVLNDASQEIRGIENSTHQTTGHKYLIEKQGALDNLETQMKKALQEVYSLKCYEYTKQQNAQGILRRLCGNLLMKRFQSVAQSPTSDGGRTSEVSGSEGELAAKRRRRSAEVTSSTGTAATPSGPFLECE